MNHWILTRFTQIPHILDFVGNEAVQDYECACS